MNKTIRTAAVFAVLSMMAVSCQKEQVIDPQINVTEANAMYTIHYTIDGVSYTEIINGEASWHQFLLKMFALAREGHRVTFRDSSQSGVSVSKEVVTYTTTSEDDAIEWASKMIADGYSVDIEYDKRTGIYTCTAIK